MYRIRTFIMKQWTHSFQAECAHDYAVLSKLDEICHFVSDIRVSITIFTSI